ncbi:MAG: pyruvate kinase [Cyanobacteria bacterium NC_groundwater_1444_Ag_S-0.65um_54_12]|nr:pyruvate kinase [Cyanobacteria bacterium NC_groundwater_1444_Ag_S-0.65um_54_12]
MLGNSWNTGAAARRGTKIVATLGPASSCDEVVRQLIKAGVDVFRLNFSHGNHEAHSQNIRRIRRLAREESQNVAILQDIQGPKIRIGEVKDDQVELVSGQIYYLTATELVADTRQAYVSYPRLTEDVTEQSQILIDDGRIELQVLAVEDKALRCRVITAGVLRPHKGVNFPRSALQIPILTDKDLADLQFGAAMNLDLVAVSFIQQPQDVLEVKEFLLRQGKATPIIAKIERREAVQTMREIIAVADGLMVARGDLGVEIPVEDVPLVQKELIRCCNLAGKPVITATQMLDSMIANPRPTRAEASDVANAILDGTDALMLSNETAIGQYPIEAVEMMVRIACQTERMCSPPERPELQEHYRRPIQDAIAHAATEMAPELGASGIVTATYSGSSARMVAKYRPACPIIAATQYEEVCRQLAVVWGVYPFWLPETRSLEELLEQALARSRSAGLVNDGDVVIMVAGVPMGSPGTTNLVKVEIVAPVLAHGTGLGSRLVSGVARHFTDSQAANAGIGKGEILIAECTDNAWTPAMTKAGAVVVRSGGLTSHTAFVTLELAIPTLLAVDDLESIPDGALVTVDPLRGVVYQGLVKL